MEQNQPLAPATNPDVGRPAVAVDSFNRQRGVNTDLPIETHISGADLTPDLTARGRKDGVSKSYKYWVGVTLSCPRESIDLAGINFPKGNEILVPDPMRTSVKRRVPVIGAIVSLTEDKIKRMRDRLERTVIRFMDNKGVQHEPGAGKNVGDPFERPRRGQVITIPTAEEVKLRREKGKPTREYQHNPSTDVPASRFLYAQLCVDQVNGSRGHYYPPPLEETGLDWPEKLEAELSDLLGGSD